MFSSSRLTELALHIGLLGQVALLADLTKPWMPVWLFIGILLLPYVIRLFFPREEWPNRVGRLLHVIAAGWYIAITIVILIALFLGHSQKGQEICLFFILLGFIASLRVLTMTSRQKSETESESN